MLAGNRTSLIVAPILLVLGASIVSASDLGTTGLITTPTARQMQDGHLAATISSNRVVNIFNITYQTTPWLETTFRYSVFNPMEGKGLPMLFGTEVTEPKSGW